ncbi:MAG: ATP-binding cassette domain-containing protein [Bacteroidales bacterium]|nr:ATP-binding cassette domain-containing protein [Bacteroidales bacterium]
MSENILKALMQLFAIIARPNSDEESRRPLVKLFLNQQLNKELVQEYLIIFDNYYHDHQKKANRKRNKRIAASSVRILTICTLINKELTLKQKIVVVVRLLEFISSEGQATDQEFEFVKTVADTFHIPIDEYKRLEGFVLNKNNLIPEIDNILVIQKEDPQNSKVKFLKSKSLDEPLIVYHSTISNMYLFEYYGVKELYLNGQLILKDRVYGLSAGSAIRDVKRNPIYFSDIVSAFQEEGEKTQLIFEARNLTYKFKSGKKAIHRIDFSETSGKLVGIMGASGSGKSTLLNVLNGNYKATTGEVLINGFNVNNDKDELEGIIGHVSQDDLLIEDLTVFQNLYYNARLCFGELSKKQILKKVVKTLKNLGLFEIRNMKVGSPLNKKISGGQRKRLNIALELIREPAILFLDEPTSGLSSRDSENILDLLKEITLKGKLIFVVIHQPSSDIFKMFDRLMILDQGGYVVYNGDPVDSLVYFKSRIKQADWNESECSICGNVNAEQIFDILESQILDEYGNITSTRKYKAREWYTYFNRAKKNTEEFEKNTSERKLPKIPFKVPNMFKQFSIFVRRDFLSKLANKQYMLINILEAPILAFLLSHIIKYFNISIDNHYGYSYAENDNIPVYIFMAVIIALFTGLTISADEIIKDRKIRTRESFLNLSRNSYLFSKIFILFMISAYQALSFILIGNFILEIRGMYWEYWLILFSTWAFAVMMGLNISDGFKTSVTIYIIIPFLIIPQIILSGIIVRYEKLNPAITNPGTIPWFGEIITARWSYEALAVNQFINNKYNAPLYKWERIKHEANFKKDLIVNEIKNKLSFYERHKDNPEKRDEIIENFDVIRNELRKETGINEKIKTDINISNITVDKINDDIIKKIIKYVGELKQYYIDRYKIAENLQDEYIFEHTKTDSLNKIFIELKRKYHNETLEEILTNKNELKKIFEYKGHLYQRTDMIYKYPERVLISHFYAPKKKLFDGKYYPTFWVNLVIIWIYTLLLYLTLYFSIIKRTFKFFENARLRFKDKKEIDY